MKPEPNAAFPYLLLVWVPFCLAVWTLYWKGSLEAKRRWHPRVIFGGGVFFLGIVASMAPFALVPAIPAVAAISYLNWKMTKFCPACAATVVQNPPWAVINFCPKCGASLRPDGGA